MHSMGFKNDGGGDGEGRGDGGDGVEVRQNGSQCLDFFCLFSSVFFCVFLFIFLLFSPVLFVV